MATNYFEHLLQGAIAGPAEIRPSASQQTPTAWDPTGAATAPRDPLAALLQGSVNYQQQHGQDPLAAAADRGMLGSGGRPTTQVVDNSATGLNHVAALSSHGPRQGQAHLTFDLGNGSSANVYFDANGRRHVYVYRH